MAFNWANESQSQLSHLFPNKDYLSAFQKTSSMQIKALIIPLVIYIAVMMATVITLSSINVPFIVTGITIGSMFGAFVILLCTLLPIIESKKERIRKEQYQELLSNEAENKNAITLHNIYRNHQNKWNRIFLIHLGVWLLFNIIINIVNAASSTEFNLGGMFVIIFITALTFIVPLVLTTRAYKKMRLVCHPIEYEIDCAFIKKVESLTLPSDTPENE